jgi:peptide/nickel transport system permease protein
VTTPTTAGAETDMAPGDTLRPPPGVLATALRMWRVRIGLALLAFLVLVALGGPLVAPYGEAEFVGTPNTRVVEGTHFGTDYFGQDVWSRFLFGGRTILVLASLSTAMALILGVTIGLVAAYNRGRLDDVLMRTMDISLAFPQLLLALVALTTIGPKWWLIVLIVGLTTTPRIARITRGAAVPVVERDFVGAAEALGEKRWRILWSELLPNVSGPLLVEANLRLTYSIGIIASLGFLGFSTRVNAADWGLMVNENRAALSVQPWGTVLPALAIAVLTIGTGLVADGLSRATAGIDRAKGDQ